jgi:hypothetical protein
MCHSLASCKLTAVASAIPGSEGAAGWKLKLK